MILSSGVALIAFVDLSVRKLVHVATGLYVSAAEDVSLAV